MTPTYFSISFLLSFVICFVWFRLVFCVVLFCLIYVVVILANIFEILLAFAHSTNHFPIFNDPIS